MKNLKLLKAVVLLVEELKDEQVENAQGDNGGDVRDRLEKYADKLENTLRRHQWEKRK